MLHKIATSDVEMGMFIHSLDGTWLDHNFWRSRFLVKNHRQLERLRTCDVDWVTIDDARGKGLARPDAVTSATGSQSEKAMAKPTAKAKSVARKPSAAFAVSQTIIPAVPAQDFRRLSARDRAAEVRRASGVLKRSRTAVVKLFEDARLGNAVKSKKMAPLVEQISRSVDLDPTVILNIARIKTKDEYTYLHSVAVCALMINLARQMRLPEDQIHEIGLAGLLHDVGKTAIPDHILMKPGKLDDSEWVTVRNHPERGHAILSGSADMSDIALEVCLRHHEKMDGTGYPGKLSGDSLSVFARMGSICDVYDALTSQRSYNAPLSASEALAKMQSWKGHFDQMILRDFVASLGILPVGTLVRMDQDQLAIVIGESEKDYAAPIVRVFHCLQSGKALLHKDINTAKSRTRRVVAVEDPMDWTQFDWPELSADLLSAPHDL